MFKFLIKILFFLICSPVFCGTLTVSKDNITKDCSDNLIDFSGEIRIGDSIQIEKIINDLKKIYGGKDCTSGWLAIRFNSDGGDVYEAIAIGKLLRMNKLRAIVPLKSQCNSACVLAIAGAIRKDSIGSIGIHRPYFSKMDPNLNLNQVKAERDKINKAIGDYFQQVDIPISLLDLMLSIPPEKMKVLNESELELYRLTGVDANHNESEVARLAKLYGLTSSEYRAKDARLTAACSQKNGPIDFDCYNSRMLDISIPELKKRLDTAEKLCEKTPTNECYMKYLRRN